MKLNREEMKNVLGGLLEVSCTVTTSCKEGGKVECSSSIGDCEKGVSYVRCETLTYNCSTW